MEKQVLCPKCNNNIIKIMAVGPSITYKQVVMACRCKNCKTNFAIDPQSKKLL